MKWLQLALGGLAGTFARYLLSGAVHRVCGPEFPYGTLTVNLVGCLVIGFLAAAAEHKFLLSPNVRLLLMAGFCGAFTTFSTFMLETANLAKSGETVRALVNVAASVGVGYLAFRAGELLAQVL
jgi:CrcB protein